MPVNLTASMGDDFNNDGATYATRELNITPTAEKVPQKRLKNFKHAKHNSLVDFSFMMEKSSTNSCELSNFLTLLTYHCACFCVTVCHNLHCGAVKLTRKIGRQAD